MRLLRTDTIEPVDFLDGAIPPYAILSHTWGDEEVSLQEMQGNRQAIAHKKGYVKIVMCCEFSKGDGFDFVWIDTCCIDKTSSAELSEAINSMYRWYEEAAICYAYLADVAGHTPDEIAGSRWFTRGWTLQELIAPHAVQFLNGTWDVLGTKESLGRQISDRTGIPMGLLSGIRALETFSVAQRMSWAAERTTTRVEDRAYSLLGIFGIYMPLIYGEKETAFVRLQEEIMRVSDDHSLFAWRSSDARGGLLATAPDAFADSGNVIATSSSFSNTSPPTLSSRGIHLEVRFKGVDETGLGVILLNCRRSGDRGVPISVFVRDATLTMVELTRASTEKFAEVQILRNADFVVRKICIRRGRVTRARDLHPLREEQDSAQTRKAPTIRPSYAPKPTFHEAAQNGEAGYIWLLLTRQEVEQSMTEAKVREALNTAIVRGHHDVVRILVSRQEIKNDVWDEVGVTALSRAVQCGRPNVVEELLKSGKFSSDFADKSGRRPLSMAIAAGNKLEMVRLVLDSGADFRATDLGGRTPISQAAWLGDAAVVKLLHANGAEVNAKDGNGRTPLSYAAERGFLEVVKALVHAGADPQRTDANTTSPLHRAVKQGHEAVVRFMIDYGVDINAKDVDGRTPLQLAQRKKHEGIVNLLLEKSEHTIADGKSETGEASGKGLFKRLLKK
ncbi:hypothetical protein OQA88_10992 [Cercophora sp. LCS_1]